MAEILRAFFDGDVCGVSRPNTSREAAISNSPVCARASSGLVGVTTCRSKRTVLPIVMNSFIDILQLRIHSIGIS